MNPSCIDFRKRAQRAIPEGGAGWSLHLGAHAEACEACRAWAARAENVVAALGGLAHVPAPNALGERVASALNERFHAGEPRWTKMLAALERQRAPRVLERLLEEELEAPVSAQARRFAGDLERLSTPSALELRIFGGRRLAVGRLRALRWLGAAAALFVAVLAVGRLGDERRRPFEVIYDMPADPHPLAVSLSDGWVAPGPWSGGAVEAEPR